MNKRRVCFIITIVGVLIIILVQIVISFMSDEVQDNINYIKDNLKKLSETCIIEEKCKEDSNVTINDLKLNNYIDSSFDSYLKDFSINSYVTPNGEVYLIEK